MYPNGFQGEQYDHVPDLCKGVSVTLETLPDTYNYLGDLSPFENRLLKRCMGFSDDTTVHSETVTSLGVEFTWQYGRREAPHLIKLTVNSQSSVTDLCNVRDNARGRGRADGQNEPCRLTQPRAPGFYCLAIFDPVRNRFKLINRPAEDYSLNTTFSVYTTTGTVIMASDRAAVYTGETPYENLVYTDCVNYISFPDYRGNIDCETNPKGSNGAGSCLERNKWVLFFDPSLTKSAFLANPKYLNIYRVKKISNERRMLTNSLASSLRPEIVLDGAINFRFVQNANNARAYVFTPPKNSYKFVGECANRGDCDESSGRCYCYSGHDLDDCSRYMAGAFT